MDRPHRDARRRRRVAVAAAAVVTLGLGASPLTDVASAAPAAAGSVAFDATSDLGSLYNIARLVDVQPLWAQGYTGRGVDVAVIDTGVAPVAGLDSPGKVIDGPDFSFDAANPDLTHLDSYGHGTHMAAIIAGRDGDASGPCSSCPGGSAYADPGRFVGIAPDARIVNVKAGATDGAVDVSQVIAAIEWTVEHRSDGGMNIGVLNLSFGTDAIQPALVDPLAYAVDRAWRAGIVVVVAAGNDGLATPQIANPATNPSIIAVGAEDPNGTMTLSDDTVPDFASHGTVVRGVDIVAPATHVLSLRVPGSLSDVENPGSVVAGRFIRGSGTSQAAAVVSGLAAVLRQKFPTATPDQIKNYLMTNAKAIGTRKSTGLLGATVTLLGDGLNPYTSGRGLVSGAGAAHVTALRPAQQLNLPATGLGSLDAARGTFRVTSGLQAITGDVDIFGGAWVPGWLGNRWTDGSWTGNRWTGEDWTGNRWTDAAWSGNRWTGNRWSGGEWTGNRWSGNRWSGNRWSGGTWS